MKQEGILLHSSSLSQVNGKSKMKMSKTLNFILFQVCWFSSVLGAVRGLPQLGPLVAILIAGLHVCSVRDRRNEMVFLAVACLVGTMLDIIPLHLGAFSFTVEPLVPWGYPLWMSALWLGFATTFRSSLSWLSHRYALAGLFGFIGGPLAYIAGEKLGAIVVGPDTVASLLLIAVFWGLITPGLFFISEKLKIQFYEDLSGD